MKKGKHSLLSAGFLSAFIIHIALASLFLSSSKAFAQYKKHFKIVEENDFFGKTKTDNYYTNGTKLQYINPNLRIGFLDWIMPSIKSATDSTYGISLGQN